LSTKNGYVSVISSLKIVDLDYHRVEAFNISPNGEEREKLRIEVHEHKESSILEEAAGRITGTAVQNEGTAQKEDRNPCSTPSLSSHTHVTISTEDRILPLL
jgi:hypothetical protein